MSSQLQLADYDDEYRAFVEKFKPKKTTDDCYTPQGIYDVILDYVVNRYGIDRAKVVRPFWPGGDYTREEYEEGSTVVDNPPFSILSQIVAWYMEHGVSFFLFAPTLTALASKRNLMDTNHIICHAGITYENGAVVPTSFVTNLDTDGTVIQSEPDLSDAIKAKDEELQKSGKKSVPKYIYPDAVLTAAKVNWFSAHHTHYKLNRRDCCPISKLDNMGGKAIFGGGLLSAERAAAERAAAERWELSERELKIQKMLG